MELCRNGQNYRRFEGTSYLLLHCRDPFAISTLRVTSNCKILVILKCFLKLAVLKVREHTHSDAKLTFYGEIRIPVQTEYSLGRHK